MTTFFLVWRGHLGVNKLRDKLVHSGLVSAGEGVKIVKLNRPQELLEGFLEEAVLS